MRLKHYDQRPWAVRSAAAERVSVLLALAPAIELLRQRVQGAGVEKAVLVLYDHQPLGVFGVVLTSQGVADQLGLGSETEACRGFVRDFLGGVSVG
jgi:hypothetical protein